MPSVVLSYPVTDMFVKIFFISRLDKILMNTIMSNRSSLELNRVKSFYTISLLHHYSKLSQPIQVLFGHFMFDPMVVD